jgi:uncharacterized protein with PQ loop repeat
MIQYLEYIGILGLILIGIGWIPQIFEIIRTKNNNLNLRFNLLYAIGSLSLVFYAVYIKNAIFIILNSFALLMSSIGLFYKFKTN